MIGLYPLLPDNSSWFIAVDFDESESGKITWQDEVKIYIDACEKYKLPVYLERSRSGRGGHVWMFFETSYPAFKSRRVMLHILESTGSISPFDKNSNYDRLFPNQDSHTGKGIGNLIALPLQMKSLENNNSCFIDPVSYMSYPDQWSFLRNIKKVDTQQLEEIYNSLTGSDSKHIQTVSSNSAVLQITLNNKLLQILVHDSLRNRLIIDDIISEVNTGKKVLVLTERKAHIATLYQYLNNKFEVIAISGEDAESQKKSKFSQINSGNFQVLISTGQFFGEGIDIQNLDCLVLAYPFSFEGKMIQYLGRVQRSEAIPVIYDYRDIHVDYLEKLFKQRSRYYQKLLQTGEIHRLDELILIFNEDKVFINTDATTLQIDQLDLPIQVEKFKPEIAWKIRVLNYDEENSEIRAEIIDYAANPEINTGNQISLQFQPIDKISFRSIDTARLLHAVELKRFTSPQKVFEELNDNASQQSFKTITKPAEWVVKKIMKVPFPMIQFSNACVAFNIFIEELNQDIKFKIEKSGYTT